MIDFKKSLSEYGAREADGYFELSIPVVMEFAYTNLVLHVTPHENGEYTVSNAEDIFDELSFSGEHYYRGLLALLGDACPSSYRKFEVDCGIFHRRYAYDYAPLWALYEFIKFFMDLNEYIESL